MGLHQRPLRELCHEIVIYELVRCGLPHWEGEAFCSAKLHGPETHGIRVLYDPGPDVVYIHAKMSRDREGMRIGTLHITGEFSGHAWVDEIDVQIHQYKH
jgi:hypothetical protein